MGLMRNLVCGAMAGAAGTSALNAATYLDMAVRGRGSSSTPQQTVETMADKAGVEIPGDEETTQNRVSGLGPMMGIVTGVGVGAVLGAVGAGRAPLPVGVLLATAVAMAGSDGPMAAMGVSDPTSWTPSEWVSDAVPHAAYGLAAVVALRLMGSRAA